MSYRKEWCVIFNPKAGNESSLQQWDAIKHELSIHAYEFDVLTTKYKRHAIELVQKAIGEGYQKFIVVGGSGTLNEVATGILEQSYYPASKIQVTTIPTGSFNDWAKHNHISLDFKEWIPKIRNANVALQDVATFSYHFNEEQYQAYSMSIIGLCLSADVIKELHYRSFSIASKESMTRAILNVATKFKRKKLRLSYNGKTIEDVFIIMFIHICKYTAGYALHDETEDNDGTVGIIHDAKKISYTKFIMQFLRSFVSGKFSNTNLLTREKITSCTIESLDEKPAAIQADGEFFGYTPCEIKVLPQALSIIIP